MGTPPASSQDATSTRTHYYFLLSINNQPVQELTREHCKRQCPRPVTLPLRLDRATSSIFPVGAVNLAPQPDVVCLSPFQMGHKAVGMGSCEAPFAKLLGLSPPLNVCPEGVDLRLCCDNIIFKLLVAGDFCEVGPVIQFSDSFPKGLVLGRVPSEHAAKPAGHGS